MNEADTCRKFVVPLLQAAGWDNDPHSINEQRYFTRGRIVVRGNHAERREAKPVDYLRRYVWDFNLKAVAKFGGPDQPRRAVGLSNN